MSTHSERNLTEQHWHTLIRQIADTFDDLTIKRGFSLFTQGRIKEIEYPPGLICAVVDDKEPQEVVIQLNTVEQSRCTCGVEGCKHMIAALLGYTKAHGGPIPAIVNAGISPSARKGQQTEGNTVVVDLAERPIPTWHELFRQCTASFRLHAPDGLMIHEAINSTLRLQPQWSYQMERLYLLHARLYVLEQLIRPLHERGRSAPYHISYHLQVAIDDQSTLIMQMLKEPLENVTEADRSYYLPRLDETLDYLRRLLLIEPEQIQLYSDFYDLFWQQWLRPQWIDSSKGTMTLKPMEMELAQLEAAYEVAGSTRSASRLQLAQSRMFWGMQQDEQARQLLQDAAQAREAAGRQLLRYLEELQQSAGWLRLQEWLLAFPPQSGSSLLRSSQLKVYASYWEEVLLHHPEAEQQMWSTLAGLPGKGKVLYTELLHTHREWRRWIDFQLSTGAEPLDYRVSMLQPIEKDAPELLLPWYHQAVERYIVQKNRTGYKAAVKLMKRLSKLYTKLKRTERWDDFMVAFLNRHSRLRALQEELRKSKLLS